MAETTRSEQRPSKLLIAADDQRHRQSLVPIVTMNPVAFAWILTADS